MTGNGKTSPHPGRPMHALVPRLLPLPVETPADLRKALRAALDPAGPFSQAALLPVLHLGPGVLPGSAPRAPGTLK